MAGPRSHTSASLHALLTLPTELRVCVEESMARDARSLSSSPTEPPADPSRVTMTSHLRAVLNERGMMSTWRRHFEDSRFASRPRALEIREEIAPIFGEFVAVPA